MADTKLEKMLKEQAARGREIAGIQLTNVQALVDKMTASAQAKVIEEVEAMLPLVDTASQTHLNHWLSVSRGVPTLLQERVAALTFASQEPPVVETPQPE